MKHTDELRNQIAQGWVAMLCCVLGGFLADLIKSAVHNDFSKWATDPGPVGMQLITAVMVIYIFMPLVVRRLESSWARWTLVGVTVFFGMFFVAHQVAHALTGTRPFDFIHAFDFSHHVLVIWMVTLAGRWARQAPAEEPGSLPMPSPAR